MHERIRYHTELRVWEASRNLACTIYRLSKSLPAEERYALCGQLKRAAVSVPANIAEGCGRGTTQELIRSLRIARGSLSELHSHVTLATDLGYIDDKTTLEAIEKIHRMLNALITSLARRTR